MVKVMVTGGTGFIGSNLVADLSHRGFDVIVLHRPQASFKALEGLDYRPVLGDVLDDPSSLATAMEGCSWVFHTAAVSDYWRNEVDWLYRINVEGTRNVLKAALLSGVNRLVFTSSLAALGVPKNGQLLDETAEFSIDPRRFPYAHSKHLAETEVRRAVDKGLPATVVNPTVVLGPRDVNQISGAIITEAAKGRLRLKFPGGVNFVAVEDVVVGHIQAAAHGRIGERYILGCSNLSYESAVSTICSVVGRPVPGITIPSWLLPIGALIVSASRSLLGARIPLDASQVWLSGKSIFASSQKAVDELGMPQTPFETAVQRTYDWYRDNGYL